MVKSKKSTTYNHKGRTKYSGREIKNAPTKREPKPPKNSATDKVQLSNVVTGVRHQLLKGHQEEKGDRSRGAKIHTECGKKDPKRAKGGKMQHAKGRKDKRAGDGACTHAQFHHGPNDPEASRPSQP